MRSTVATTAITSQGMLETTRSLAAMALPFLHEAEARSGETVVLAVIDRSAGTLTYIEIVESQRLVRYSVPVGTTRPLYATSSGRVMLAHQDPVWLAEYLRTVELRPLTAKSLTDRRQLARVIQRTREQGWCSTLGEVTSDVAGFAAPENPGRLTP